MRACSIATCSTHASTGMSGAERSALDTHLVLLCMEMSWQLWPSSMAAEGITSASRASLAEVAGHRGGQPAQGLAGGAAACSTVNHARPRL